MELLISDSMVNYVVFVEPYNISYSFVDCLMIYLLLIK